MTKEHADALIVTPSPMLFSEYPRIASMAASSRLPAMGAAREFADLGGLMSSGANLPELARQTAACAAAIMSGYRGTCTVAAKHSGCVLVTRSGPRLVRACLRWARSGVAWNYSGSPALRSPSK